MDGDGAGDPLDVDARVDQHEARTMTPLTRVVLLNLAWRFGVQVPVFVTYRILSGGSR